MGGNYEPPQKDMLTDAKLITRDIASVRLNKTRQPIRIFVDLKQNKVCEIFVFKTISVTSTQLHLEPDVWKLNLFCTCGLLFLKGQQRENRKQIHPFRAQQTKIHNCEVAQAVPSILCHLVRG